MECTDKRDWCNDPGIAPDCNSESIRKLCPKLCNACEPKGSKRLTNYINFTWSI